jgi:3-oxoacid CoA-transferase subunit A
MIMEITKYLVTGDTHGDFSRFYALNEAVPDGEMWAVIILGDAGLNFWLNKRDAKNKYRICEKYPKLLFYCVRGNHEARPEDVEGMVEIFDGAVWNYVYWEPKYPNIAYLQDGVEYCFGDYKALVLGGAYSVDKYWRLEKQAAGYYGGWFENEQLSQEERDNILDNCRGRSYDLILAHTCPWEWEPRDLFLSCVDQSNVDDSMEKWLGEVVREVDWKVFLCGHFHDDRTLAPHAEMLSTNIKFLDDIMEYWK